MPKTWAIIWGKSCTGTTLQHSFVYNMIVPPGPERSWNNRGQCKTPNPLHNTNCVWSQTTWLHSIKSILLLILIQLVNLFTVILQCNSVTSKHVEKTLSLWMTLKQSPFNRSNKNFTLTWNCSFTTYLH